MLTLPRERRGRLACDERNASHEPGCFCFARGHRQSIVHVDCGGFATRAGNAISFRGRESSGQSGNRHNEERKR